MPSTVFSKAMFHRIPLPCFLVVALLLVALEGRAEDSAHTGQTLVVRVSDYPPQYYQDDTGRWTGLDVELARAVVVEAGFIPKFVPVPWARALEEMKSGRLQLMTTLSKTAERSAYMNWIGPERIARLVLVVREADKHLPIKDLDDLFAIAKKRKTRIGIQHGVFYGESLARQLEKPEMAKWFDSVSQAILNARKTRAGRIIGFFEDELSMQYQIKHREAYQGLAIHSFVLQLEPVYFGVSQSVSDQTLEKLQAAFHRLETSGKLERIRHTEWW